MFKRKMNTQTTFKNPPLLFSNRFVVLESKAKRLREYLVKRGLEGEIQGEIGIDEVAKIINSTNIQKIQAIVNSMGVFKVGKKYKGEVVSWTFDLKKIK